MTEERWALQKALTRALNRMYTPIEAGSQRIEWTEERVERLGFAQLKHEQQHALVIVYGPRASFAPDEVPAAVVEMIEGAKEVIDIIDKILEAET